MFPPSAPVLNREVQDCCLAGLYSTRGSTHWAVRFNSCQSVHSLCLPWNLFWRTQSRREEESWLGPGYGVHVRSGTLLKALVDRVKAGADLDCWKGRIRVNPVRQEVCAFKTTAFCARTVFLKRTFPKAHEGMWKCSACTHTVQSCDFSNDCRRWSSKQRWFELEGVLLFFVFFFPFPWLLGIMVKEEIRSTLIKPQGFNQ